VAGRLTGVGLIRELQLAGRPLEVHAAYLVAGVLIGLLAPLAVALALTLSGVIAVPWIVPLGVILVGGVAGLSCVQADLHQRAQAASRDLRHQLSAYVDVLTMLLAANMGNEGALRLAADAGDGRLFTELRRRIGEAGTAGRPAVSGLAALGRDLGLVELTEIAASASLATSQGAPVARSLAAKTQSLRAALQAEQEEDARIRTGKITFPLVAMGIVFMVMGLYPALAGIQGG
jgi:Flp pilus assembly protein TadB